MARGGGGGGGGGAGGGKPACPGQPYWPLCDAEALVENQLSRYAAAPGQLTQDQAAALLQSITVYPPQDGTRRIELRWSF